MILYMYIAPGQGQITSDDKISMLIHLNLVITRSAGARQRTVLVKRTVLKRNVPKTDSERRVTETVFDKVCLHLIQAIIFRIMCFFHFLFYFVLRKKKKKIGSFTLIKIHVKYCHKDQSVSISL